MQKLILAGLISVTILAADFIRDDERGVVRDDTTFLIWQDDTTTIEVEKGWEQAIAYCEALEFVGYDDWRLPNINELLSTVDNSKSNPAIKDGFENILSRDYWSSTTQANDSSDALGVDFGRGYDTSGRKSDEYYVRCVRDGQ